METVVFNIYKDENYLYLKTDTKGYKKHNRKFLPDEAYSNYKKIYSLENEDIKIEIKIPKETLEYVINENRTALTSEIESNALWYANLKHFSQKRKDGTPFILHAIRVSKAVEDYGLNYTLTGLLHDVLEDTNATEDEVAAFSNYVVLEAVKTLTKGPKNKGKKYIANILENPICKAVKNADRIDNLNELASSGDSEFIANYLKNTKQFYYKKFSPELDGVYKALSAK